MRTQRTERETKLAALLRTMGRGNWKKALSLASRFPRLGRQADAIRRGHEASQRPEFYRGMGQNPEALITIGIYALKSRYNPQRPETGGSRALTVTEETKP